MQAFYGIRIFWWDWGSRLGFYAAPVVSLGLRRESFGNAFKPIINFPAHRWRSHNTNGWAAFLPYFPCLT